MASVYKRPNSPYWMGAFLTPAGKWEKRSTKLKDKAAAQTVADEWQKAATLAPTLSSHHQARRVIRDICANSLGPDKGSLTVRKFCENWLKKTSPTVGTRSTDHNTSSITCFLRYLGDAADKDIDAVGEETLINWRASEAQRVTAVTVNHRLKIIRRIFTDALADGYVTQNPAAKVKRVKLPPKKAWKVRRPFTMDELERLHAVMDEQWRVMLWMGFFTGQRMGDLATFKWEQINFRKCSLYLDQGKTGTPIWQPVPPELITHLNKWRKLQAKDTSPNVLPTLAGHVARHGGRVALLSKHFAQLLFKAGLRPYSPYGHAAKNQRQDRLDRGEIREGDNRRARMALCFHTLRHTARSVLEEANMPKAVIDAYIGHEGDMGVDYTTIGQEALRRASTALSAFARTSPALAAA